MSMTMKNLEGFSIQHDPVRVEEVDLQASMTIESELTEENPPSPRRQSMKLPVKI